MNPDALPIISQTKSLYFLIKGNKKKAKETQIRFSKQCVGVSQIRSAVQLLSGDAKGAKQTQDEFTATAPIIAQLRSGIEAAIGKSDKALKTQQNYLNNLTSKHNKVQFVTSPNIDNDDNKNNVTSSSISASANLLDDDDDGDDDKKDDNKDNDNNDIDITNTNSSASGSNATNQTNNKRIIEVPNEFLCSITWEIMKDPVICSDGHTYEKISIEEWLKENDTSPKTNLPLDDNKLIPNRALKNMIVEWKKKYNYDDNHVIHGYTDFGETIITPQYDKDNNNDNSDNDNNDNNNNDIQKNDDLMVDIVTNSGINK